MKIHELMVCVFLFIFPCYVLAGWQVVNSSSPTSKEINFKSTQTYFYPGDNKPHRYPYRSHQTYRPYSPYSKLASNRKMTSRYVKIREPIYAVSISGSVKENVERIMHRYRWKVIWKAPYDFNFDGRITGSSLPNVIEKLLQPFPLQAVMYMSNRTLAVIPRNKT